MKKKKKYKWICKSCLKGFRRQDHFASHLMKVHGQKGVMFLGDACYSVAGIQPIMKSEKVKCAR